MHLIQIEFECALALHAQRLPQYLGCDEGIAVAVAADPASNAQERGQLEVVPGGIGRSELVFQRRVEARQLAQKSVIVVGKSIGYLVYDVESAAAQHAGLPQREHGATQGLFICRRLFGGEPKAIALRQQVRHLHLSIDRALAPHLRRMGGEDRANDGAREKVLQPGMGNVRITSASKRVGHGAFARSRSGQRVGSRPADVMLVFGDVGELRKVAESADDLDVLTMREAIQRRLELVPRGFIFFAVEADRGPADVLDDREDRLAFLAAHRIAKNAAEQTDIVTQRQILVGSFEQIHDHTNSNDAAAEAALNSTTAIGVGFPVLTPKSCTNNPSGPSTNGSTCQVRAAHRLGLTTAPVPGCNGYRCDSRDIPAAIWLCARLVIARVPARGPDCT